MKIACQSCQAKYTIADEKVLGRVVKIRCKKCSATIVINGNEAADTSLSPPEDPTAIAQQSSGAAGAFDYAAPPQGDEWTVNVGEGDQRTMRSAQIVSEYKAGVVNDETYCWKDGMTDWLPLREIPALASACAAGSSIAPAPPQRFTSQAPTAVVSPGMNPAFTGAAAFPSTPPVAMAESNGSSPFGQGSPTASAAARRAGGRGAPGADLFGNAADAGGENDVMTSAPQGTPQAHENGEAKLTGQRNENSVLFSLSALTSNGPKEANGSAPPPPPQGDGSGLIDIRALASSMSTSKDKSSHVDDIMNLGGGGAFTAALAAPVLAAPPMEMGDPGAAPQKGNKGIVFALLGVMVALVAVVIVLLVRKPATVATTDNPTSAASGTAGSTAGSTGPGTTAGSTGTTGTVAAADTSSAAAAGTASAPTAATVAAADPTKPPPVAVAMGGPRPATAPRPNPGAGGGGNVAAPPAAPAAPPPAAPAAGGADAFAREIAKAGGGNGGGGGGGGDTSGGGGGGSAPFDRGAAAGALSAVNVQACKKGDGPTGGGHVSITFAPSGSVANVTADQPPFAGTAVGGCVAAKFRAARVPAFSGGSVKVGKSFSIN